MNVHSIYARISPILRRRRMRTFEAAMHAQPGQRLLDVGGTAGYWSYAGDGVIGKIDLTLLNLGSAPQRSNGRVTFVSGNGCSLPFPDQSFDIVFSNSVIEHVGTWENQQAFAAEARRVGRKLWIQTPAREFFIEPHLIAPFVHWLPRAVQKKSIRNLTVRGWLDRPTAVQVDAFLDEVRLLTFAEMQTLFPDCTILRERMCGLTKSYIALRCA